MCVGGEGVVAQLRAWVSVCFLPSLILEKQKLKCEGRKPEGKGGRGGGRGLGGRGGGEGGEGEGGMHKNDARCRHQKMTNRKLSSFTPSCRP